MSLFRPQRAQQRAADLSALGALADRTGASTTAGSVVVTQETALRQSAVWACLRQRSNLLSTLPVDAFRRVGGVLVEVAKPKLLVEPDEGQDFSSWLWASQFDLDRYGNTFGIIHTRDGNGIPTRVELLPAGAVSVRADGSRATEYRYGRDKWSIDNGRIGDVWHEKAHAPAGFPLGLNQVQMAAWTIGGYLSAQEFALNWFAGGGVPSSVLKNDVMDLTPEQQQVVKRRFVEATRQREPVVLPKGWSWELADVPAASTAYMEEKRWSITDVARFLDWPADLIDGAVSGQSITYASITQRNLQALVMHLGPAAVRREAALSRALQAPRLVKLNTDALLRMDPETVSRKLGAELRDRLTAPSEARALMNRAPYTPEQLAEFEALFGPPRQPTPSTGGGAA